LTTFLVNENGCPKCYLDPSGKHTINYEISVSFILTMNMN